MTNPNYTHVVLVVDRSGSMDDTASDATGGIKAYLEDLSALPKVTVSLYQFDNVHDTVFDFAALKDALKTGYMLRPRNMTALLDAVGFAVTEVGERLAAMAEDDRPGKVAVLIVTDGYENASSEWTRERVKELLTRQQDEYGWGVTYIGANVDAFAEGGGLGVAMASSLGYEASSVGTRKAYAAATRSTLSYATGATRGLTYTDEDREEAAGR